jgi:outer membrane protein assembly factor BamB
MILLLSVSARADDWPEFRGPTGEGIARADNLPIEWSTQLNVAWKQTIPGGGWSSPVVWKGRIYLTTSVPVEGGVLGPQSLRALCLDARTGQVEWNIEVMRQEGGPRASIHSKNSHASSTPVIDGKRLYVHFGPQGTACLDLDGKVIWRNQELRYDAVHGNGGSPILIAEGLVFSADGSDRQFLVLLNRDTGKVVWKTDRRSDAARKFSFSTPLLIIVNGRRQIISPGSGFVASYDPGTGEEIWRVRYEGYSVIPRPVYGHGLVYVCTGYGPPTLMAIRPDGSGDVTETHVAWTLKKGLGLTPSPLLDGDELYVVADNGLATCVDARAGTVHWHERLPGSYSASPILAGGRIYFQNEEGLGVVLQAGKLFKELARNNLGERSLASYAVADGALFIRTKEHLYRIQRP